MYEIADNFNEHSLDEATNNIISRNTGVIIIDTCCILDIIRIPLRSSNYLNAISILDIVIEVVSMAKSNPPQISLVIPPLILKEFNDHVEHTIIEIKNSITDFNEQYKILFSIAGRYNSNMGTGLLISKLHILDELHKLCSDLIDYGIHLGEDKECTNEAMSRSIRKTPPAKKGTSQDSYIYLHGINLISKLRKRGFRKNCIFFTTNTNDYCEKKGHLFENIDKELSKLTAILRYDWLQLYETIIENNNE
ncbi:MAG: hypothetical protein ABIE07_14285 [Candidatus Zixiibacteriota bacterium]